MKCSNLALFHSWQASDNKTQEEVKNEVFEAFNMLGIISQIQVFNKLQVNQNVHYIYFKIQVTHQHPL